MVYRRAKIGDLLLISKFTDWWISGRGKAKGVEGAVNDCFVSPSQHKKYIEKYETWLCVEGEKIIAWAVVEPSGTMIHLLVAGDKRGMGIASAMMSLIRPKRVRSKMDQSSGNPIGFYEKMGFKRVKNVKSESRYDIDRLRPNRRKNIDIMER